MKQYNLLIPGRHHVLTNFQYQELTRLTNKNLCDILDVNKEKLDIDGSIENIIRWVTSSNHSNTRRNPISGSRREAAIQEFSRDLEKHNNSFVYHIDDIWNNPKFAEYLLKKIEVESDGQFTLTPDNTIVWVSTPGIITMYEKLWFKILPLELEDRETKHFKTKTAREHLNNIVELINDWKVRHQENSVLEGVSKATRNIYKKYKLAELTQRIHADPLLWEDGDITETREYNSYVRAFDNGSERKYDLIKNYLIPGKIVDIGCCTWSVIKEITKDPKFIESDFYGIEVANKLYNECLKRKEEKYFENDNVFFYKRNIAQAPIFPENSIQDFTTFSLTHEIQSYQGPETIQKFLQLLKQQLAMWWRWINVDVVGPENKEQQILMKLNTQDGINENRDAQMEGNGPEVMKHLEKLSTHARFLRFAQDFRAKEWYKLLFEIIKKGEEEYVQTSMQDACEFLSKKDYTDNRYSEMHETFCFRSFSEWKKALEDIGFVVHPDSNAYKNPWIIENRFKWKIDLFDIEWKPLEYPVTNMLMIAEKQS
ncbi:MAG: hypothetical protein ACD_80C00167G0008 [uncultured bacterium (gcode 4)]|uniref:Methyltransferase n=1 Tax=uncultured bacterium (gcode 4) TaxID=1234023 RepID=K1X3T1_9BACT|nr:MAG: hypothetical protein ACD_80C00167G0008 [uncultured bacterium (gcode 4)]